MSDIPTLNGLIITQLCYSVVFLTARNKGLDDDQIAVAFGDKILEYADTVSLFTEKLIAELVDAQQESADASLNSEDEPWMMDFANRAVEANLNEDGSTKFNSAQGYACAMAAIKLLVGSGFPKPEDKPSVSESPNVLFVKKEVEERTAAKQQIIDAAVEYFKFTAEKYGDNVASERTLEWVAERHGVAEVAALGLSTIELKNIHTAISQAVHVNIEG